jgi:hypothetical protein
LRKHPHSAADFFDLESARFKMLAINASHRKRFPFRVNVDNGGLESICNAALERLPSGFQSLARFLIELTLDRKNAARLCAVGVQARVSLFGRNGQADCFARQLNGI